MKEYEIRTKLQAFPTAEVKEDSVRILTYIIDGIIPNKLLVVHGNFPINVLKENIKEDTFSEYNFYLNAPDLSYHIADYGYWPGVDMKECMPIKITANSLLEVLDAARLVRIDKLTKKGNVGTDSMLKLICKCIDIVNLQSSTVPSIGGYMSLFKMAITQSKGKSHIIVNNYINSQK